MILMMSRSAGNWGKYALVLFALVYLPLSNSTGQISISQTGSFFLHPDGTPFYWLGDTGWGLFQKPDRREVDLYLKARAKQGFTVVHAAACHANPFVEPPLVNSYGDSAFHKEDLLQPAITPGDDAADPEAYDYWDHVEYVINTAAKYDIHIVFLPIFGMAEGDGYNLITPDNAYDYGKFLGDRFKDKTNIIWCMGGDVLADNERRKSVWNLLAKGVTEGVAGREDYEKTLMTFHTRGGHSSSEYFPDAPWLDFHMLQTWASYHRIYDVVSADYARMPKKPILHGEGAYEDGPEYPTKPITPHVIRKQFYWAVFAGGTHTYGNSNVWSFGTNQDYVSQNWKTALHADGARQLGTARNILESIHWWDLIPDQSLITEGENNHPGRNVAMRSGTNDRVLLYLSEADATVTLDLSKIPYTYKLKGRWINPQTGKRKRTKPIRNLQEVGFTTPSGWEDALLLIRAKK